MAVTLKLTISETSEANFKKAVFRFIERHLPAIDQDIILTTVCTGDPNWIRADIEFSSVDLARRFGRFLGAQPFVVVQARN